MSEYIPGLREEGEEVDVSGPFGTRSQQKRRTAHRVGRSIGGWLGNAMFIGDGYVWARFGILWALVLFAVTLVVCFAVYGLLTYPWSNLGRRE